MSLFKVIDSQSIVSLVSKIARKSIIFGDGKKNIQGVSSLDSAVAGYLCFCDAINEKAQKIIETSNGDIFIVSKEFDKCENFTEGKTLIVVDSPMLFFIDCLNIFFPQKRNSTISGSAFIDDSVEFGENVLIEPMVVIKQGVKIGNGTEIHSGACIYERTIIGDNVIIRSNAVVGATGLAYGQDKDLSYVSFPHLGGVIIENRVEIGANTTIVKGILADTTIGSGTKIGNQVNIGHNVSVGKNCFISAGAILCGSVKVEDNCWIAPGAKIINKVVVGHNSKIGLGSVVLKNVDPESVVAGVPAKFLKRNLIIK